MARVDGSLSAASETEGPTWGVPVPSEFETIPPGETFGVALSECRGVVAFPVFNWSEPSGMRTTSESSRLVSTTG
jgi:hypothetical protein